MDSGVVRVGVERSETGACPELTCWEPDPVDDDERDSPLSDGSQNTPPPAPVGLTFIGAGFYDDARPRLGPIVEGGTFELDLVLSSGGEVPEYRVEIDDTDVLSARYGTGDFAPGGGYPIVVDGFVTITAHSAGQTYVRVVEPATSSWCVRAVSKRSSYSAAPSYPGPDFER